jgi:hypothetical protein
VQLELDESRMKRNLSMVAKVSAAFREYGIRGLCKRVSNSVYNAKTYGVYVVNLDEPTSQALESPWAFREASPNDIEWICKGLEHLGERGPSLISQQFDHGDITVVGTPRSELETLSYIAWLSHEDFGLSLLGNQVNTNDVSIRRVWVPPQFRRQGIGTLGQRFSEQCALSGGSKHIWSFVLVENVASSRMHESMGYRLHSHVTLAKYGNRRYAKVSNSDGTLFQHIRISSDVTKL